MSGTPGPGHCRPLWCKTTARSEVEWHAARRQSHLPVAQESPLSTTNPGMLASYRCRGTRMGWDKCRRVALRADPGAHHQFVGGVWSGCQRLSQSDEGRHSDQDIAEWGVADCAQTVSPLGVSAGYPVPRSPQTMGEWAEWQPPPPGGQRPNATGYHYAFIRRTGNSLLPGRVVLQLPSCECRGHRGQGLPPIVVEGDSPK